MRHTLKSRQDLKYYLKCDKVALGVKKRYPNPFRDTIWRFEILLRKTEYWSNKSGLLAKFVYYFYKLQFNHWSNIHGLEIPLNVIGEGLVIWHLEKIIINENATIGKNLSLSAGVTIGQAHDIIPKIGNNVELTMDAKVLGVRVADRVTIGAGAVVVKNIDETESVWGGVPAKKISNNFPEANLLREKRVDEVAKG